MSLLDLPVRRPMAVSMIFVGFVVLGVVAYQRIPLELFPPLEGDQLSVRFFRPNSEQEVVERELLLPLHARVSAMPDIVESWGRVDRRGGSLPRAFRAAHQHEGARNSNLGALHPTSSAANPGAPR